jgi:hypothetical protein
MVAARRQIVVSANIKACDPPTKVREATVSKQSTNSIFDIPRAARQRRGK